MGILKEIFGERIELPDGGHLDCLLPEIVEQLDAAERKALAEQAKSTSSRQLLLPGIASENDGDAQQRDAE